MKARTALSCLAAAVILAATPTLGLAQRAGFQAGIAQPPLGSPPPQAPAIPARSTFTAIPQFTVPFPQPIAPIPLVPNFPTVIVPNQILVPGQTVIPSPFVNPFPNPFPGVVVPNGRHLPPRGTPRADVLRMFGQPSVTVITSTGETLYFTGGVTVIIQNGQVAGPR